jgi:hypothetical protein
MKVALGSGGVPIVVTYRQILKKPKIVRERRFVGALQMVKNLLAKAIELVEGVAFETTTEVLDPGQSVSVHWAISVEDPWDTTTGAEKGLVAYRMLDDIPPSGVHFEVITPLKEEKRPAPPKSDALAVDLTRVQDQRVPPPMPQAPSELTPEQFRSLRARQDAPSRVQGSRVPPAPAPEYGPRRVKTIEEEAAEAKAPDEDAEDLGGAGPED